MRRIMLFGLAFLIAVACSLSVQAQVLRIDSLEPQVADRGDTIVLRGSFGDLEPRKVVRFARIVNRQAEFFYPGVRSWTRHQVAVVIPGNLPVDRYLVTIVHTDRPTWYSNNATLTIRKPAPPATAGGGGNPVVVLPNRCATQHRQRSTRVVGDYEISSGGIYAACETMRTINDVNARRAFSGGEITIAGDFGDRRADQYVALAQFEEVYSERQRRSEQRLHVSHLLQIVGWSPDRMTLRISDLVRPNEYRLLILNRLSRTVVPGIFEQGSNITHVEIRSR